MIVDRRSVREWDAVRAVFSRVVTLFPARIREVYLGRRVFVHELPSN